jgi:hypothetical protein
MTKPSEQEKGRLVEMLTDPVMKKWIDQALQDVWQSQRGCKALEESALAYKHMEGATSFISALFSYAEIKERPQTPTRKLKHI